MKHDLDTLGYLHINNPNTREFLTRQANLSNLVDIWHLETQILDSILFTKDKRKTIQKPDLTTF